MSKKYVNFQGSRQVALFIALAALSASTLAQSAAPVTADPKRQRGEYLVNTSACHDCHTPWIMGANGPEPDMSRMLSGHPEDLVLPPPPDLGEGPWMVVASESNTAWSGPWGVSFTANLTPDRKTGLGKWSLRNFVETIRSGRHLGRGRQILPPMPIPVYQNMTDQDLEAIFTYLQSIPAISNQVPKPLPPVGAAEYLGSEANKKH